MIIFDLDGTLADCEHRRHFVDPSKNPDYINKPEPYDFKDERTTYIDHWYNVKTGKKDFKPHWGEFYEACDKDKPIYPTIQIINNLILLDNEIQIWSGRCESVREKTEKWLYDHLLENGQYPLVLKMRQIGDSTPDDELKERWLDEYIIYKAKIGRKFGENYIDFVFDDRPKVIRMWRRRGIFVFNCYQHDEKF